MQLNDVPRVLCHPDGRKSCGACCGMYNHIDHARDATYARLRRRSEAMRHIDVSDEAALTRFRETHEPPLPRRLMPELPTCPFVGFVGSKERSDDANGCVGCLVHPSQNDGTDGRDAGVYDQDTCETYLCAAHDVLRNDEKWLVIAAIDDSYTYGLVVTDPLFVRQLFQRTATLNGGYPTTHAVRRTEAIAAACDYFALKTQWPWRALDGVFGQVTAGIGLDTPRRTGPSASLDVEPDPHEAILRCLGTQVRSVDALHAARAAVDVRIRAFARATA